MKLSLTLFTLFCLLAIVPQAHAQKSKGSSSKSSMSGSSSSLRVAVVDVEKVAKELPEAVDADKMLTDMKNKMVDSMHVMEKNFKEKYDAYTKNKTMMTPDAQKKEEESLAQLNQQYSAYQEENLGAQGTLARKRAELIQPVISKIQDAVKAEAKDEGYVLVLDKVSSGSVLYADDAIDITYKVIDRMKRMK